MPIELNDFLAKSWTHKNGIQNDIKLAVLAAGLGKRMNPLTSHHLPKPMFPLGGSVPMMEMWVRRAVKSGITDISMNLCVLKDTIKDYFGNGHKFGATINYVEENTPTGTLGGICKQALGKNAKKVMKNETMPTITEFKGTTVIAPSGDIVTNFGTELLEKMYRIHKEKGAALTMVLTPIPWEKRGEFGTVELEAPEKTEELISQSGKIVNFREKDPDSPSNLNNASIYMIEMELLKTLDALRTEASANVENPFYDFGKHVFPAMLGKLDYIKLPKEYLIWGIQYDGLWYDVGRKRDYINVNKAYLDGDFEIEIPYKKLPWGYLGTNTAIDFSKVRIIPPVIIGNDCIIAPETTIGPYAVVGDGWTIERKATVSNSVLWKRYSYFPGNGEEISLNDRKMDDMHQVRRGASVDECIIVGGTVENDLREEVVDVRDDGRTEVIPIDWIPDGQRA
ncbi:MAG: NDP-sugar synthase [bacterium]|nr:NDP-sugar synthase [bacterium]